jgi:hypothetical protein
MPGHRRPKYALLLTFAVVLNSSVPGVLAFTVDSYIGPDQGLWTDPDNWSAGVIPDYNGNDSYTALINPPLPVTVRVTEDVAFDDLTVAAGNVLSIEGGGDLLLYVQGSPVTLPSPINSGTIRANGGTATIATFGLALASFTNTGGVIEATNSGIVNIRSTTLIGGTLRGLGGTIALSNIQGQL